ncbi:MAG: helix-turn-helix domain-containing protein [Hyphomicrobiales bacterium]|nr:helix-turn-helix domain-containing protein [Hyphomicrobiales bacterium]
MNIAPNTLPGALLTEVQAADFLNVSPRTLQTWRLRGGGPTFVKMGKSVRYRAVDLDAFVCQKLANSTSELSYGGSQ